MRASTRSAGQPELAERDPEGGLQADHPGRRLRKRHLLGLGRVRGVVGGDGVDRAVHEPRQAAPPGRRVVRRGGLTLNTGS